MSKAHPVILPTDIFAQVAEVCPTARSDTSDVITVVVDEKNFLGKNFTEKHDGTIDKDSAVSIARGVACQYCVPDFATLQNVLRIVSENPHAAIINAGWNHAAIGERFVFLSKATLESMGLEPEAVTMVDGMTAFARLKNHANPSTWQLLDRDEDEHTPEWARKQSFSEWRQNLDKILPGVAKVKMLRAHSSSARVLRPDGSAVGGGNGHVWIKVANPADVNRTRTAIVARALEHKLAWTKPRISKSTGQECGRGFASIADASVWTIGRLIFAGSPTCSAGLKIIPQQFELIEGEDEVLDTSLAVASPLKTYRASARQGAPLRLSHDGTGYSVVMHNLSMDTEIELEDGSVKTVRDMLPTLTDKVRCQAPFRASSSMAAFIALDSRGAPFVFDSGTDTRHVLAKPTTSRNTNKYCESIIREVEARLIKLIGADNVEAVLDEEVIRTAWDASFFLTANGKIAALNRNDELVELKDTDFSSFGIWRNFGYPICYDMLEEIIAEMNLSEKAEKALRKSLTLLAHGTLVENLKIYKQAKSLDISIDMFAKRGSLTVADGVATIDLPHRRFVPKLVVELNIINQVIEDFILHFPEFLDFLALVLYARFATDRRHAFVWLHSPSSWGKGFLLAIFIELGLVVEVQPAEIEKAMTGGPVGLSMIDTLRSWILFVDEFKAASSELKLLNRQISISPKNQLRCTVQLYTKLFASAENVRSLVGDGAEAQFNNRFAYLSPSTYAEKLEDRPLFQELGKAVYVGALVNYVADYLNDGVDRLRAMGAIESSKEADIYCEKYQSERHLDETFGKLEDTVDDTVEEIRNCLIEYAHWNPSGNMSGMLPDVVQGIGPQLLNTLKRIATVGYVSKGEGNKHRCNAIVLGQPVPFIKSYLALSGDRSTVGKMQYKAEEIAAKLHMRPKAYRGKVRVYEPDSKNCVDAIKAEKRGIVIFIPDNDKAQPKPSKPAEIIKLPKAGSVKSKPTKGRN